MSKKFETPESTENFSIQKNEILSMTPKPETVFDRRVSINKQRDIKQKEKVVNFCSNLDNLNNEFSGYEVNLKGATYILNLKHLEYKGKEIHEQDYSKLKKTIEKNPSEIDYVTGVFSMERKNGGIKIQYILPASLLANPDSIKDRLINDFSGGTAEYYNKKNNASISQRERSDANKGAETEQEKSKNEKVKEASSAAKMAGAEVTILAGEGLTSMFVVFPQGKQLRISSTTGAIWECEEIDNGKRVNKNNRSAPIEFILPNEKDPGL